MSDQSTRHVAYALMVKDAIKEAKNGEAFGRVINFEQDVGDSDDDVYEEPYDQDEYNANEEDNGKQDQTMTFERFRGIFGSWKRRRGKQQPYFVNKNYAAMSEYIYKLQKRVTFKDCSKSTFDLLLHLQQHGKSCNRNQGVLKYELDEGVRRFTEHEFSRDDHVANIWASNGMLPYNIKAVPQYIMIYNGGGGGHWDGFQQDNLVGIFLLGLGSYKRSFDKENNRDYWHEYHPEHQHVRIMTDKSADVSFTNDDTVVNWTCQREHMIGFYADLHYRVAALEGLVCEEEDYLRGHMVFYIYKDAAEEDQIDDDAETPPATKKQLTLIDAQKIEYTPSSFALASLKREKEKMMRMLCNTQKPFGFLLAHQYTEGYHQLKGIDARLFQLFDHEMRAHATERFGLSILPAVLHVCTMRNACNAYTSRFETSLFPFTKDHADQRMGKYLTQDQHATLAKWKKLFDPPLGDEHETIPVFVFDLANESHWNRKTVDNCYSTKYDTYLVHVLIVHTPLE